MLTTGDEPRQAMTMSAEIKELATALAKAQGQITNALKDSENPHFRSKFADLSSVWAACRSQLSENGLSVIQRIEPTGTTAIRIVTMLLHESGQWINSTLDMTPTKNDPQGVGSVITYGRRYALSAMVGIAPDDDDGNAASQGPPPPPQRNSPSPPAPKGVQPPDKRSIMAAVAKLAGVDGDAIDETKIAFGIIGATPNKNGVFSTEQWNQLDEWVMGQLNDGAKWSDLYTPPEVPAEMLGALDGLHNVLIEAEGDVWKTQTVDDVMRWVTIEAEKQGRKVTKTLVNELVKQIQGSSEAA